MHTTTPTPTRVELQEQPYDEQLVAIQVHDDDTDREGFPRALLLTKHELQQLVDAAHQLGVTPAGTVTPPF